MKSDYKEYLDFATDLIIKAGNLLHNKRGLAVIKTKKDFGDFATDADYQVEELILAEIKKRYPKHSILSEEKGDIKSDGGEYRWVIDPLDGTRNYQRGLPYYGTIITLEHENKTILSVLYFPETKEVFKCLINNGSYLNGKKISCSTKNLSQGNILMYYSRYNYQKEVIDKQTRIYEKLLKKVALFNFSNTISVDFYRLAQGCYEGVIRRGGGNKWWDVAGGILAVRESGGIVTNFDEEETDLNNFNTGIVATNGKIHDKLLKLIEEVK
ncbi:inositol monophosphatase [Candidatus Gottesmanbacteria bacterium]|nr:inositol monophosphatase [Candidatus Gottesmanbacteria bacterium]